MKASRAASRRAGSAPATTVAAGWPAAISPDRFGPESTHICSGSKPREAITRDIVMPVSSSIPLVALSSVISGFMNGSARSRNRSPDAG